MQPALSRAPTPSPRWRNLSVALALLAMLLQALLPLAASATPSPAQNAAALYFPDTPICGHAGPADDHPEQPAPSHSDGICQACLVCCAVPLVVLPTLIGVPGPSTRTGDGGWQSHRPAPARAPLFRPRARAPPIAA